MNASTSNHKRWSVSVLLPLAFLVTVQSGQCACIQTDGRDAQTKGQSQPIENSGTLPSQARLLIEINQDLVHGSISPQQAVDLRQAIDGIGQQEDCYLVSGQVVPSAFLRQESIELNGIQEQLKDFESSNPFHVLAGSASLQDQVRSDVQSSLKQGTIVANRATDLMKNIDLISAEEAWCLTSDNGTIPENVIEKDVNKLADLDGQLKTKIVVTTNSGL
jgi:hypothetical protein